jgi:hypothetical protein
VSGRDRGFRLQPPYLIPAFEADRCGLASGDRATFDVWQIEVLSFGAQVRLYTKAFAERLALRKERLFPVIF